MRFSSLTTAAARLYEVSSASQRTRALDGTRGLAVVLVFFVHYHALFSVYVAHEPHSFTVSKFLEVIGHCGVELFFTLSGYLIYGMVIQKPVRYFSFLGRRVQRIYPTFLCVLALYLALIFAFPSRSRMPKGLLDASLYLIENIALLPGFFAIPPIITVAWTLSYEFVFYLTIPLVVGLTGMRSWKSWQRILLFMALGGLFFRLFAAGLSDSYLRMLAFLAGVLLWDVLSYTSIKSKLTLVGEIGGIAFYLGSLILLYWVCIQPSSLPVLAGIHNLPWACRGCLVAAGNFVFGLYCFGYDGVLNRMFSLTPIRWLGNISYSYYLIHGLTLNGVALILTRWLPPSGASPLLFWAILPCAFGVTLITATILFAFVEKPFSLRQRKAVALPAPNRRPSPIVVSAEPEHGCIRQTVS